MQLTTMQSRLTETIAYGKLFPAVRKLAAQVLQTDPEGFGDGFQLDATDIHLLATSWIPSPGLCLGPLGWRRRDAMRSHGIWPDFPFDSVHPISLPSPNP